MNFGSKFVYYYNESDEEEVSDDSDDGTQPPPRRLLSTAGAGALSSKKSKSRKPRSLIQSDGMWSNDGADEDDWGEALSDPESPVPEAPVVKKTKKVRKSDPNVFTIDVADYVKPAKVHRNNKRLTCTNCSAIMTGFSNFKVGEGENNWICEFCFTTNPNPDVTDFTKPESDDVTFLLKEPEEKTREDKSDECYNVIFVIDISGSMGTTKQMDHVDANGRRTRTFVSRLDAVKRAAEFQIKQLKDETPNVRVGVIAFGSSVQVFGDGSTPLEEFHQGALLSNKDAIKRRCEDLPALKPISETYGTVSKIVEGLRIKGNTALGPGLWSALVMAANVKGSKIIICTDGCANNGIGTLSSSYHISEEEITNCREVYKGFGDFAIENSLAVSVVSMEGADCKLVHLGMVAQMTGGIVDIVDIGSLNDQFGNILTSRTVALDVTVMLCLHHTLYIRDKDNLTLQNSTMHKTLGNVTTGTDMIVEFGVKTVSNENEQPVTILEEDQQEGGTVAAGAVGEDGATGVDTEAAKKRDDKDGGACATGTAGTAKKRDDTDDNGAAGVVSVAPADDAPAGGAPADGAPADGAPADGAPADGAPVGGAIKSDGVPGTSSEGGASGVGEQLTMNITEDEEVTGGGAGGSSVAEVVTEEVQPGVQETNIVGEEVAGPSQSASATKKPSELPFQLQLKFVTRDGFEYIRVVTNLRQCTDERAKAEAEMDFSIVGAVTSKTVSDMGLAGDYVRAKGSIKARKLMNARYQGHQSSNLTCSAAPESDSAGYQNELMDLEGMVRRQAVATNKRMQPSMRPMGMQSDSLSPDMLLGATVSSNSAPAPHQMKMGSRSHFLSDDLANQYYDRSSRAKQKYSERLQKFKGAKQ